MRLIDADELREQCHTIPDPKGRYFCLDIIEKYEIDEAPTIYAVTKPAGKWLECCDNDFDMWVECSCCHYESGCKTNFCPKCGADMRGAE